MWHPQPMCWPSGELSTPWKNAKVEPTEAADPPASTSQLLEGAASGEDAPMEPGEPEDVHVALMVDATNGVNELSRKATLWTVRHRWAAGARFTFNCCWYSSMLILRRRGQSCCILLSHEE